MAGSMTVSSPSSKGSERSPLLIATKAVATFEPSRYGGGEALPVLAHKYSIESKHIANYQKLESTRRVSSTYGTLMLNQVEESETLRVYDLMKRSLEPVSVHGADPANGNQNQSETESDSDGSCGLSATHPQPIQSILRIRTGDITCRSLEKKNSSVGFAIDISDTDDEDDEYEHDKIAQQKQKQRRSRGRSCSARCIPRRLTLEEKAELYRVRPDLELTPMPILLRDVEEMRRRWQRKLVFSLLGGTLILLMMVVMFYVFSQA